MKGGHNRRSVGTTAEALCLDANVMRKTGALESGRSGNITWKSGDQVTSSVCFTTGNDTLTLTYRTRSGYGNWATVTEHLEVTWSACRYGGTRPYLVCPTCSRPAVKLYVMGQTRCRECHGLVYETQRVSGGQIDRRIDQLQRRADRIKVMLGGEPGMFRFPPRPKGMHKATYERLRDIAWAADCEADDIIEDEAERRLASCE